MQQDTPASDETVRFRDDGAGVRPPLDGARHGAGKPPPPAAARAPEVTRPGPSAEPPATAAPQTADEHATADPAAAAEPGADADGEPDDTRPVTRDWLLGAPDAGEPVRSAPGVPAPAVRAAVPAAAAPGDRTRTDATPTPPADDDVPQPVGDPAPAGTEDDHRPDVYAGDDDFGTQKFDLTEPEAEPEPEPETRTEPVAVPAPADRYPEDRHADRPGMGGRTRTGGSGSLPPLEDEAPPGSHGPRWRRKAVLVPVGAVTLLAAAYGIDLAVSQGSIPRSTVVAGVDIGGLSPAAAATALENELAPRIAAERTVLADDVEATLSPTTAGLTLDVDGTLDAADHQPLNPWTRLVTFFDDREVPPVIAREETALSAQLESVAAEVDRAPVDATITFEGTTPSVVDAADGRALDREGSADAIVETLAVGAAPETPIELPVEITPVRVDRDEAERVLEETVTPAVSAPVQVVSADGSTTAEVSVAAIVASLTFTPEDDGELAVSIDPEKLQTALGDELGVFGTPAKDADFQVAGSAVTVVPSVDGTGVDPALLADQLIPVLTTPAPRSVTAELGPVPADFTTQEAEALGIKEQISTFTTRFTSGPSGTNIRVVAAEVDGALVMPGETFSLNTFTGPRGTAQGYVESTVIQRGQLAKAVGGGISQFATTMFNAVFFAGLEDVYHKPHSFYISRYPAGREATVYEGAVDLQWRNDSDTGVYIDTTWVPGAITVSFYGTKRYEIEAVEGPRTNFRQPARQEKVDVDGTCIEQPGIPGFDVTVTRIFRDLGSGEELRRETFTTSYAAEAIIRCIPPAEAPSSAPSTPGG